MSKKIEGKVIHNSFFIPTVLTLEMEARYFRNRSISDSRPDTDPPRPRNKSKENK